MNRSFLPVLAAAILGAALATFALPKVSVHAQAGPLPVPVPSPRAVVGTAVSTAVPAGGDVVLAYDNGLFAIIHPGTSAAPSGFIHTYRVDANGKITGLSSRTFDSDTGQLSRSAP